MSSAPYEYIIEDLTPAQVYFVRVSAFNQLGYGAISLTTPPNLAPPKQPPSAPTSPYHVGGYPVLKVVSDSSLTVYYGVPDFDGGATITQFKIEWDTANTFNSHPDTSLPLGKYVVDTGDAGEYTITGLSTGVEYFVRVWAYNVEIGYGDVAFTSPASAMPRRFPSTVTSVDLSLVSATSLSVSWDAATDNGSPVDQYVVEWFTKASTEPYFGTDEVQTIQATGAAGTYSLGFGAIDVALPGTIHAVFGVASVTTTADLTESLRRGDQIIISETTYIVDTDTSSTFDATTLPLHKTYEGVTAYSIAAFAQHMTGNLPVDSAADTVLGELVNLPSIGQVTVTLDDSNGSGNYIWTVAFTSGKLLIML